MEKMLYFSKDFWYGALSVTGLAVLRWWYSLHLAPSVASIQQVSTAAVPNRGDDAVITVWGFDEMGQHRDWKFGVADQSPYVARVEAYLRLIQQPYLKVQTMGLSENPQRRKVPLANIKGTMVDDSRRIIETLKHTFEVKIDDHLTQEQVTMGYLIREMLCGSLYWVLLHQNFETEEGRQHFRAVMNKMPLPIPYIRFLICQMVLRHQNINLRGSGYGLLPHAELVKKGQSDVRTLSSILGLHQFILGTSSPTSYDADVYAFVVHLFYDSTQTAFPWVTEIKQECSNLVEYIQRMRNILFPELKEEKTE